MQSNPTLYSEVFPRGYTLEFILPVYNIHSAVFAIYCGALDCSLQESFYFPTELIKNVLNNVTVSVDPVPTNNNETALSWTLSAPCRVDAELWLCQMPEGGIGHCGEVQGSRQRLHAEKRVCDLQWTGSVSAVYLLNAHLCYFYSLDNTSELSHILKWIHLVYSIHCLNCLNCLLTFWF